MKKIKQYGLIFIYITLLLTAKPVLGQQEIKYLLPAPANLPAFGPWMVAYQKGYYAQEGLKVRFVEAKGGVDVARQLGAGSAMVGGAMGDTPILVRSRGIPVKAVAVLGGKSLMHIVSRADQKITNPRALKGKTITVISYQDTAYYSVLGVLHTVGLTKKDVVIQGVGSPDVWRLVLAKKADAMAAVPDWIAALMDTGAVINILPSDPYFKNMPQAIIASDQAIQQHPQLIKKLVRATLRGMKDIMINPKEAARVYIAAVPQFKGKETYIEKVFTLYNQYVYSGQGVLGYIDEKRIQVLQHFYVSQGIVSHPLPVDMFYSNHFVQ